jgi:hypothetical protein
MKEQKQGLIDKDVKKENAKQIVLYLYHAENSAQIRCYTHPKMSQPRIGPFELTQVVVFK